ncbi:unnamed protein product [Ambrosiozyma monospora]|uniref:Unnamed protein product n=1 Tax=Ambrosiozyma monospora TaxID=43982 RepID=A0ACB5TP71_AMBMO|nr:unnamed protein product [Ambrosiozyma monospora]
MDTSSCKCTQKSVSFSGDLAPLDEELSVHFRGPLKLLQFGVYYPSSSSSSKRDAIPEDEEYTAVKHVHHQHKRAPAVKYVDVTATVVVDGDGNTVTSEASVTSAAQEETAAATTTSSSAADETTSSTAAAAKTTAKTTSASSSSEEESSSATSSSSAAKSSSSSDASGSDWSRKHYYSSSGSADGITFLNTKGGSGSGVFDNCFGNSISYASSDGQSAASSAQTLEEVTIGSDVEFLIMSDSSCDDGDDGCGYYRDGIPAFHGFGGSSKIFVFEFEMPDASSDSGNNANMPAVWLLNAKIPRTAQYGSDDCSCWSTGCGEVDLFEILDGDKDKLICHVHEGSGCCHFRK